MIIAVCIHTWMTSVVCCTCIILMCILFSFVITSCTPSFCFYYYFLYAWLFAFSVPLRMYHVTAHNTLPFVPLLYCSVVTHIHIFPCIRILIILVDDRSKRSLVAYRHTSSIGYVYPHLDWLIELACSWIAMFTYALCRLIITACLIIAHMLYSWCCACCYAVSLSCNVHVVLGVVVDWLIGSIMKITYSF